MEDILDFFKNEASFLLRNRKNLINVLILGILIVALPVGLSILRRQQIIKARAAVDPITFAGANVRQKNDGTWVATNSQIQIQLISPLGLPPGGSSPTPSPSPTPTPTSTPTPTPSPTPTPTSVTVTSVTFNGSALDISGNNTITTIIRPSGTPAQGVIPIVTNYSQGNPRTFYVKFIYQPPVTPTPTPSPSPRLGSTIFGVGLIPANFPNQTPQELERAFVLAKEIGDHTGNIGQWRDYNLDITRILLNLSRQHGLKFIAGISPTTLDQDRCKIDAPAGVVPDLSNPATRNAFKNKAKEIAALGVDGLALATEINYLEFCTNPQDRAQLNYFVSLYNEIYNELKTTYPNLPIFVTFQYDELYNNNQWSIISRFKQDWIGLTSYPDRFGNPGQVPADYYSTISQYVGRRPVYFMEMGWPAQNSSGEEAQKRFIQRLPALFSGINPRYITWSLLHDVTLFGSGLAPLNYVGLRYNNGTPKLAYEAAKNLVLPKLTTGKIVFKPLTNMREIWVANDDGSRAEKVATGQSETYSPPAFSPDGTKVVFQDGFVIKTIDLNTKAVREVGSGGHADWSPDGRKLVYCEVEPESGALEIWVMDNDGSHKARIVPHPQDSEFCDPEWSPNGTRILFSGGGEGLGNGVYVVDVNPDGTNPRNQRRLTNLDRRFSDHDASWSPDSQNIVFNRYEGSGPWSEDTRNYWSIFKVDLAGRETRLTPAERGKVYSLPVFSPDGSEIMYSTNTASVPGLEWCLLPAFLMNPDGLNKHPFWGITNILCTNFYDWGG